VLLPYCGLKHKVQGRAAPEAKPVAGTCLTYGCKTRLSTQDEVPSRGLPCVTPVLRLKEREWRVCVLT
jgi:hypothetical protein